MESYSLDEDCKAFALNSPQGVLGGGEADMEGMEIKVEMDRAVDPLYILETEPQLLSKLC